MITDNKPSNFIGFIELIFSRERGIGVSTVHINNPSITLDSSSTIREIYKTVAPPHRGRLKSKIKKALEKGAPFTDDIVVDSRDSVQPIQIHGFIQTQSDATVLSLIGKDQPKNPNPPTIDNDSNRQIVEYNSSILGWWRFEQTPSKGLKKYKESGPLCQQIRFDSTLSIEFIIHTLKDLAIGYQKELEMCMVEAFQHQKDMQYIFKHHSNRARQWWLLEMKIQSDSESRTWVDCFVKDITSQFDQRDENQQIKKELNLINENIDGMVYQFKCDANHAFSFNYISDGIRALYGIPASKVYEDVDHIFSYVHPDDREIVHQTIMESLKAGSNWSLHYRIIVNQHVKWLHGKSKILPQKDGITIWNGTVIDITKEKMLEVENAAILTQLRTVFDNMNGAFWQARFTKDKHVKDAIANQAYFDLTGTTKDQVMDESKWLAIIHPQDTHFYKEFYRNLENHNPESKYRILVKNEIKWIKVNRIVKKQPNGELIVTAFIIDVTHQMQQEEDKRILIREVHHRVRNNLQIIMSLMDLRIGNLQDEESAEIFNELKLRIKAISQVHSKLMTTQYVSSLNMGDYANSMIEQINRIYNSKTRGIEIKIAVEPIPINLEHAVRFGLILTELVSNSFKHAFPESQDKKWISISIQSKARHLFFGVKDNGIGFDPVLIHPKKESSFGLEFVDGLTSSLNGKMKIKKLKKGTNVVCEFPLDCIANTGQFERGSHA